MVYPGSRVMVFDPRLFVNDRDTPLSVTMKPATVVCRYGRVKAVLLGGDLILGPYPDLIDVVFDHRPERVSVGHFCENIKEIE